MSNYRIERLLGIGGEAVVYEVRPLLADGDGPAVACKVMREARRANPGARALVKQEAALGLRITPGHRNLVEILDCFEDAEGRPGIVMELVDGGSLRALRGSERLPHPIIRRVLRTVLEALVYLHGLEVLHRDLSPCNILISTSGSVKVADLGIAKVMERGHAHTRTYRGKLAYGSPEAIQTATLDARSDLYTLGAVLYELLTGTPPCGEDESLANIVMRALREDFAPLPPDTPADLAELTMGLLRTEREARRPQSATEALALLRRHDQPVASQAELAAMVTATRSRPGAESDSARRESSLAPGEALAPGHVLVTRSVLEPGASMPDMAPAQAPALPLPAEPAPARRITTTFAGPGSGSSSPRRLRLAGMDQGYRSAHGWRARPVQQRDHGRWPRSNGRTALAGASRSGALVHAARAALLGVCVLVSGFLLHDRSRGASDVGDAQERPAMPAPVLEPAPIAVRAPEPPIAFMPAPAAPEAKDRPAHRVTRKQRDRDRGRAARVRPAQPRASSRAMDMEPVELYWEPATLGSALPPWATP